MNRIADLRPHIKDMSEAIGAMSAIAHHEACIAIEDAKLQKRLVELTQKRDGAVVEHKAHRDCHVAALRQFISEHRDLFAKPRKHKCEYGEFGLQAVSEVDISDEVQLLAYLEAGNERDAAKYGPALAITTSPVKLGIKALIAGGEIVPGCTLRAGDTAVYKIAKRIIEDAVELSGGAGEREAA